MKKINFKSPYFWGLSLGLLFIAFNVLSKPLINSYSESQINKIDFASLQVKKINGEITTLKELSKSKKVVLNFWATWCRPCLTEMPILQDAYDEINKETIFILINDQNLELTKEYMNKNKYTFEFVQLEREVFMKHGIMERPTTVLLDADFTIKKIIIQQIEQENGKEFIEFLNKNI